MFQTIIGTSLDKSFLIIIVIAIIFISRERYLKQQKPIYNYVGVGLVLAGILYFIIQTAKS